MRSGSVCFPITNGVFNYDVPHLETTDSTEAKPEAGLVQPPGHAWQLLPLLFLAHSKFLRKNKNKPCKEALVGPDVETGSE